MKKILVIQTAFIGDVVLATGVLESLHTSFPDAQLDFLVRMGNESLLKDHPFIHKTLVWDKKQNKYQNLFSILTSIRKEKYDAVYNLQRFAASGLLTALSGAKLKVGFKKNPFSFAFTRSVNHEINNGKHEIERNFELIENEVEDKLHYPRLYPSSKAFEKIDFHVDGPYVVIAPTSVWFTKQFPEKKWLELIDHIDETKTIFLIGSQEDRTACLSIKNARKGRNIISLAGKLNLLESTALMEKAQMNYTNDSAPMHMAGSVGAKVTAVFCSTIPDFGFGPFLPSGKIAQTLEELDCRPCGLHGRKECPRGDFACAQSTDIKKWAV